MDNALESCIRDLDSSSYVFSRVFSFIFKRWRDKQDVLRHLPTKDLCLQSVIYAKLMTDRKTNGLADFNAKFQYDPIALNSREL